MPHIACYQQQPLPQQMMIFTVTWVLHNILYLLVLLEWKVVVVLLMVVLVVEVEVEVVANHHHLD